MAYENNTNAKQQAGPSITLEGRQERRLIRSSGSKRYVDFVIRVGQVPEQTEQARLPLKLALVLDRSGSMQGKKMATAKEAALALLDQLTSRDQMAVVIFDDHIDVIQKLAPVTAEYKSQLRSVLQTVQARANTALHEGWLTGCNALTEDTERKGNSVARCFLLTDGIANVGVTDPERIAGEAAGVREHTGISTSTFGIGNDYNELLLGPMAVAGGGQFHHLRTAEEIIKTFVGELGGMLAVAARQVRLEIKTEVGVQSELLSAYWENDSAGTVGLRSIAIGDLQSEEERHVVLRFAFPERAEREQQVVQARLVWLADDTEKSIAWQELRFSYASNSACDDEPQNADVMHWAGLNEVDKARREAVRYNNQGDLTRARASLGAVAQMVSSYAAQDQELQEEVQQLQALQEQMVDAPMAPDFSKEVYYKQQNRSRSQADYRSSEPAPGKKKS